MPLDETPKAAGPATDGRAETETGGARAAPRFAAYIANLDPGSAAALRRGPLAGAGAAAFWRLAAEYASSGVARDEPGWAALVQAIAILTPKGRETDRTPAYDPKVPMGAALHEAGISELRLARLLGAPREMRRDLAVRLCRRLAATEHKRFDLRTLEKLILFDDDHTNHKIARDYYRAEAEARRASDESDGREVASDA